MRDKPESHLGEAVLKRLKNVKRLERFHDEVRVLERLDHPNVVKLIDYDLDGARPFFVMGYTAGWHSSFYLVAGPQTFGRHGVELSEVLLLYLLGGAAAGTVVGITRRLIRGPASAMVVGIFATFPIALGVYTLIAGSLREWGSREWISLSIFVIVFGAGGGNLLWRMRDA